MADAMKLVPVEPTTECSTCHKEANPAHYCDRHSGGPWCDECWKVGDCTDLHGEGCHTMAWALMDPDFSDGLDRAFLASPPAREEAPAEEAGELDGTDAAHPAWWRGHEQTTHVLCQKVVAILDGEDDGSGVANDPWESVRRRLIALRNRTSEPEAGAVGEVAKIIMFGGTTKEVAWAKGKMPPVGTALYLHPAPATADKLRAAVEAITSERRRQVDIGRTVAGDDGYTDGQLAQAASAYAFTGAGRNPAIAWQTMWPLGWGRSWWKPKDRRYDLVRAGALIVAEIERLDRLAALSPKEGGE